MPGDSRTAFMKYQPYRQDQNSYTLPDDEDPGAPAEDGLPIPPAELLQGYADSPASYLRVGAQHVQTMRGLLSADGFELPTGGRVLDFGCGIASMTRHLRREAETGEVWGVDVRSTPIQWCKRHLDPPFHFATTTTIPHLPFPDRYFALVLAASVFTHIDDLADAWLLEVRRVLAPGGRFYATFHDDFTLEALAPDGPYASHWLGDMLRSDAAFTACAGEFGMLVIERDVASQVFYRAGFLARRLAPAFHLRSRHPGAHGYQTAYLMSPR